MPRRAGGEAARFEAYVAALGAAVGHADRAGPLRAYLTGLLLPGERKSVEPMAAKVDPRHVRARHQSMPHVVANAPWDAEAVVRVAREYALAQLERHARVAARVVDDTGMPKKGAHSVGVARQYCGPLGKADTCQVAVTVSLANAVMSVPGAYRLYLPGGWATGRRRRRAAGVPDEVRFQTKWAIALAQIDQLLADDLPRAPVVADAGYGVVTAFGDGLTARGLVYAVGITADTTVWPGDRPVAAAALAGAGPAPDPRAADRQASSAGRRRPGAATAPDRLAPRAPARRDPGRDDVALRRRPRPARAPRRPARRAPRAGVAADGMAAGRVRADHVLAVDRR